MPQLFPSLPVEPNSQEPGCQTLDAKTAVEAINKLENEGYISGFDERLGTSYGIQPSCRDYYHAYKSGKCMFGYGVDVSVVQPLLLNCSRIPLLL